MKVTKIQLYFAVFFLNLIQNCSFYYMPIMPRALNYGLSGLRPMLSMRMLTVLRVFLHPLTPAFKKSIKNKNINVFLKMWNILYFIFKKLSRWKWSPKPVFSSCFNIRKIGGCVRIWIYYIRVQYENTVYDIKQYKNKFCKTNYIF